jgi:RNA polymerase sigma-70 factor (sigma-E family)
MRQTDEDEFTAYVAASSARLRRTAFLICGDWQHAEDAVQNAMVKLYVSWARVRDRESLDGFVRTTLIRGLIDEGRRPWRRERPVEVLPDRADSGSGRSGSDDRMTMLSALAGVPPRQRAVLVLRFYEDRDVAEAARLLGCSEGTVKSQTARGLARLRELLGDVELVHADTMRG